MHLCRKKACTELLCACQRLPRVKAFIARTKSGSSSSVPIHLILGSPRMDPTGSVNQKSFLTWSRVEAIALRIAKPSKAPRRSSHVDKASVQADLFVRVLSLDVRGQRSNKNSDRTIRTIRNSETSRNARPTCPEVNNQKPSHSGSVLLVALF